MLVAIPHQWRARYSSGARTVGLKVRVSICVITILDTRLATDLWNNLDRHNMALVKALGKLVDDFHRDNMVYIEAVRQMGTVSASKVCLTLIATHTLTMCIVAYHPSQSRGNHKSHFRFQRYT